MSREDTEKLPHVRMIFNDELTQQIAIKLLCLHIKHSTAFHTNDRPRLCENLRKIIEVFLGIDFKTINDYVLYGKVESLTPKQIDIVVDGRFYDEFTQNPELIKIQV